MKVIEHMAKNQVIVEIRPGSYFLQSYESVVAARIRGKSYVDLDTYDYSGTTIRYRNRFFHCDNIEFHRRLNSGEIEIIDNLEKFVQEERGVEI